MPIVGLKQIHKLTKNGQCARHHVEGKLYDENVVEATRAPIDNSTTMVPLHIDVVRVDHRAEHLTV